MAKSDDAPGMPSVRFYKPSAPLADFVTSFYVVEASKPLVDHLHPEWGNIRLVLRGLWRTFPIDAPPDPVRLAALYGPTDRTRRVEASDGLMIGIGLTPLGWLRLTGVDARKHANRVTDLADVIGTDADALVPDLIALPDEAARIAHLTRVMENRIGSALAEEPLVRAIHAELAVTHYHSVALLADKLAVSDRTLHRACLRQLRFLRQATVTPPAFPARAASCQQPAGPAAEPDLRRRVLRPIALQSGVPALHGYRPAGVFPLPARNVAACRNRAPAIDRRIIAGAARAASAGRKGCDTSVMKLVLRLAS